MKTLSLFFEVHRPMLLKTYRFFDMGVDHNYLDDARNRTAMQRAAMNVFLPMNALLADLIRTYGDRFHVSFYLSGLAIEQMRSFAPDALQSFRDLAATGNVEFVAGTYSDSLASLAGEAQFRDEVVRHTEIIRKEFGQTPRTLYNTAMLYSDTIGEMAASMGYQTMLAEGARHLLGWKSANYVYANPLSQKLRVMLRNYQLSDDIAFRFSDTRWSEWPLTAEKYLGWIEGDRGDTVNLCLDYDVFGSWQRAESGIFDFVRAFVGQALDRGYTFASVGDNALAHQPIGILHAPHATSWADEERDTSAWLGNELQQEAFNKLYAQYEAVRQLDSPDLNHVWNFLQTADHFYWMGTKWFTEASRQNSNNPYGSSYDAFINYMNVLSDFINELTRRREAAATAR